MLEMKIDTSEVQLQLKGLAASVEDWRRPLRAFRAYMMKEIRGQVRQAGKAASGGFSRGAHWQPFAKLYTRKDGTVIPAWGGVKKVRGKGKVKGRLRRNGKRVTPGARIFQGYSTKRLKVLMKTHQTTNNSITLGPPEPFTHLEALRPWVFFRPQDVKRLERIVEQFFTVRVRE